MKFQEIQGVSRRNLLSFPGETRVLLMVYHHKRLETEKSLEFKPCKTAFPAENKGLEKHFLVIFISCLEPKPLKKCF